MHHHLVDVLLLLESEPLLFLLFPPLCSFMSRRVGRLARAVEIQRASLPTFVTNGDLSDSELQDLPTTHNDRYNDVSSSFSLLKNQHNPSQTFTSAFNQKSPTHGDFTPHFEPGTSSNQISVSGFLADHTNVRNLLVIDAQTDDSSVNLLITGQANYQKKRKSM